MNTIGVTAVMAGRARFVGRVIAAVIGISLNGTAAQGNSVSGLLQRDMRISRS
jgi:hypothetical protein